jgi:hypothetical protein
LRRDGIDVGTQRAAGPGERRHQRFVAHGTGPGWRPG